MQTVELRYNVPVGLSLEEFVDKSGKGTHCGI